MTLYVHNVKISHWTTYPLTSHPSNPELLEADGLRRFVQTAERAGFSGVAFTDHPAPSQRWLNAGGHDALDPFAVLAYIAGITERIRLIPNIVVLPYRNPFLVAKAAVTVDVLSGGRFVLSVATGYLRSEYKALGVDFDRRNELFDEALEVIKGVWQRDEFDYEGGSFSAFGVTANPKPDLIPIWIGGNSALSRRRVARIGDGWNPFPASAALAETARTSQVETLEDLAPLIDDLRAQVDLVGRDPNGIDVSFTTGLAGPGQAEFNPQSHLVRLEKMAKMGVTWNSVSVPGHSLAAALEALEAYGESVIDAG